MQLRSKIHCFPDIFRRFCYISVLILTGCPSNDGGARHEPTPSVVYYNGNSVFNRHVGPEESVQASFTGAANFNNLDDGGCVQVEFLTFDSADDNVVISISPKDPINLFGHRIPIRLEKFDPDSSTPGDPIWSWNIDLERPKSGDCASYQFIISLSGGPVDGDGCDDGVYIKHLMWPNDATDGKDRIKGTYKLFINPSDFSLLNALNMAFHVSKTVPWKQGGNCG